MRLSRVIRNPYIILEKIGEKLPFLFSDRQFIRIKYRSVFGRFPNLSNPQTYNEKINWMKLYDHNPLYTELADKYEVRKHVSERIGDQYLIPLIGVYDDFKSIDFDKLPDRFVIKCNHDSGGVKIIDDKSSADTKALDEFFTKRLKQKFWYGSREWAYKDIKPRIIIEKRIEEDQKGVLKDYKFFCFSGRVEYLFIATDRELGHNQVKFDYYDRDFNLLPMRQGAHPNSGIEQKKPENFSLMIKLAEELAKGFPAVRIDLYNLNGTIYFGEYTFYHHGGFVSFIPEKYDYEFGKLIDLSQIKGKML